MHRMFLCWENINKGITMKVETAQRIHSVKEYYFSTKLREVAQLRKEGKPIINLGIGSPDLPPHVTVREKMASEISKSEGHGYQSYTGIPELREAFSRWYQKIFGSNTCRCIGSAVNWLQGRDYAYQHVVSQSGR